MASNMDSLVEFQSRGVVIAIDLTTELLVFVSPNAGSFPGLGVPDDLLGRSIPDAFGREVTHALRNVGVFPNLNHRRRYLGDFGLGGALYDIEVYSSETRLFLDVNPSSEDVMPSVQDVVRDMDVLSDALVSVSYDPAAFRRFVSLLKTLSGFHYAGLHRCQPSGDLPIAVVGGDEALGALDWYPRHLHAVRDVTEDVCAVVAKDNFHLSGLLALPEDKSSKLAEAGFVASASLGLWQGEALWGGLTLAHRHPRLPSKRFRIALEMLRPLLPQTLQTLR